MMLFYMAWKKTGSRFLLSYPQMHFQTNGKKSLSAAILVGPVMFEALLSALIRKHLWR